MNEPIVLSGNAVISIDKDLSFVDRNLLKFEEIDKQIEEEMKSNFPNYGEWTGEIGDGVSAEVLRPGKDWQKGKLKLVISYRIEFIPDRAVELSPLDDLRLNL